MGSGRRCGRTREERFRENVDHRADPVRGVQRVRRGGGRRFGEGPRIRLLGLDRRDRLARGRGRLALAPDLPPAFVVMLERTPEGDVLVRLSPEERSLLLGLAGELRAQLEGESRDPRSEHTSELQSRFDLVCRLLLEKKKKK